MGNTPGDINLYKYNKMGEEWRIIQRGCVILANFVGKGGGVRLEPPHYLLVIIRLFHSLLFFRFCYNSDSLSPDPKKGLKKPWNMYLFLLPTNNWPILIFPLHWKNNNKNLFLFRKRHQDLLLEIDCMIYDEIY